MATQFQRTSISERYFAALAIAERRALHSFFDQHIVEDKRLGYLPWMRVTTMHFRRTLQRALCTPSTGQCETSSDRTNRAGTGNGSCTFFMFAGVKNDDGEVRKLETFSIVTEPHRDQSICQYGSSRRAIHFAPLASYPSRQEHRPLMLAIWSPFRNICGKWRPCSRAVIGKFCSLSRRFAELPR